MNIEVEVIDCVEDIIAVIEKKEKHRLYQKEYREKNKEKLKLSKKEYYEKNREKIKKYCQENKENKKLYMKQYNQSPEGMKSRRISDWKKSGMIVEDWDGLY